MAAVARCSSVRAAAQAPACSARAQASSRPAPFAGLRRASVVDKDLEACPVQQLRLLNAARPAAARRTAARAVTVMSASVAPKKILMLGGTRFIGVYLARMLVDAGHDVTLLTRGKKPVTFRIPDDTDESFERFASSIKHIACDRTDAAAMKQLLGNQGFEVVYDINGREADEAEIVLDAVGPNLQQYIFCSSAGVYKKSEQMPHREEDDVDFNSRHKGKLYTEDLLQRRGVNWTSVRPVYIYGPLNYNPVEEWFFHRIKAGRPIPVPNSGMQVTQLGHVKDLATAFVKILGNPRAARQVYNISGERFVTFDGLAKACAQAMGFREPELVHYNPKDFDFGKAKAFPMRDQHFFASVDKAMEDLDWAPEFGLLEGLQDSYDKDFGRGTYRKEPDYTTDDMILERVKGKVMA
ncbi:chloroplast stem-loop-binding [Chlorella sorokiniana]|uniref:Chloroplast stem-loop-binding n=1 Tax=Chlorella sorokiniana TaxID=3076 RepID=A0A2P6TZR7_CHLSO|nr:chloroplast stem-loop-binding [Chlorella sorokiniana]|eukprot:PRW59559.1 chloroplast stem-loop-binding [Chlorella sorokiniana]